MNEWCHLVRLVLMQRLLTSIPPEFRRPVAPANFRPPCLPMAAFLICLLLAAPASASGDEAKPPPEPPEIIQSYQAALKAFQTGLFDYADKEFGEFTQQFPEDRRIPEVVLLQAQSRFQLRNFEGVVELLKTRLAQAGGLADQYRFWMAEAEFQRKNFASAADFYSTLLREFPQSAMRLEASYGEAFAQFQLGNRSRTIELLRDPNGAFQTLARSSTNENYVVRGYFLLAEALFRQKNFPAVEETLAHLENRDLSTEQEWERQFLLGSAEFAGQKPEAALERIEGMVALAKEAGKPVLHRNALTLKAEILRNRDPDQAMAVYEEIAQIKGIPANQARQAVLNVIELHVLQNRFEQAIQRLETFAGDNPNDRAQDLLRLTLGELHLKHFYALAGRERERLSPDQIPAASNLLAQARLHFDQLLQTHTNSSHTGKALLHQGWGLWEEAHLLPQPSLIPKSQASFEAALEHLRSPPDQAEARFKLADCQFYQKDFAGALDNYQAVLNGFSENPAIRERFFDQAFYQVVRSALELRQWETARLALDELLDKFGASPHTPPALLFFAQKQLENGQHAQARTNLELFQARFAESPLLADARLALARTFELERNWTAAIAHYENWVGHFTNHAARSQAEYSRAWVHYQAGNEENALRLFSAFPESFPSSSLAPFAQFWVADYYFNRQEFATAELNYQHRLLLQHPSREIRFRAVLDAAKSAYFRAKPSDARSYLLSLIDDPQSPPALLPEAYFVLGDVELENIQASDSNPLARFENAIVVFSKIPQLYPNHRLEPLARGKIAHCHFQLASQDPQRYAQALAEYQRILESPIADVSARSEAEFGIGNVLEQQAELRTSEDHKPLLEAALDRYLNIVFGKSLRPGERPDPFWIKEAGLKAGQLAERLNRIPEAVRLYERLASEIPVLRPTLEKRLLSLRQQTRS
jgi:outer membrane protein assembly factor BamD (BamD/ComL family)